MSDLCNFPKFFSGGAKRRAYDEQRQFLFTYNAFLGKSGAFQKAIEDDLEEVSVYGPFSESELRAKYTKCLLNSLGAEIKDLTRPDVRTLCDAAHGGANRHIHLTMQPERPSLAEAVRIIGGLKIPAGAKFDGGKAHRIVLTYEGGAAYFRPCGPMVFFTRTPSALSAWRRQGETGAVSRAQCIDGTWI